MKKYLATNDALFLEQLADCTLPPALFNHEGHLRLAWLQIRRSGIQNAVDIVCRQIKNYAASLGAPGKYNTTLTVAAVKAVYHFMLKEEGSDFNSFITLHPRLKTSFKELMAAHYSFDIYHSPAARMAYAEPDLLPFD
jgi:hypothetical protein